MTDSEYDNLKRLSIDQLARKIVGASTGSSPEMARLVYNQLLIEQQHEYAKQQIELQHSKNEILLKRQLRWIKFSAILNAIALLAAVVLGWFLAEWKAKPNLSKPTQQSIQSQRESSSQSTPAPHSERKNDKAT